MNMKNRSDGDGFVTTLSRQLMQESLLPGRGSGLSLSLSFSNSRCVVFSFGLLRSLSCIAYVFMLFSCPSMTCLFFFDGASSVSPVNQFVCASGEPRQRKENSSVFFLIPFFGEPDKHISTDPKILAGIW